LGLVWMKTVGFGSLIRVLRSQAETTAAGRFWWFGVSAQAEAARVTAAGACRP
jgi:hypothetical protein